MIEIEDGYLTQLIIEHLRYGYRFRTAVLFAILHIPKLAAEILAAIDEEEQTDDKR